MSAAAAGGAGAAKRPKPDVDVDAVTKEVDGFKVDAAGFALCYNLHRLDGGLERMPVQPPSIFSGLYEKKSNPALTFEDSGNFYVCGYDAASGNARVYCVRCTKFFACSGVRAGTTSWSRLGDHVLEKHPDMLPAKVLKEAAAEAEKAAAKKAAAAFFKPPADKAAIGGAGAASVAAARPSGAAAARPAAAGDAADVEEWLSDLVAKMLVVDGLPANTISHLGLQHLYAEVGKRLAPGKVIKPPSYYITSKKMVSFAAEAAAKARSGTRAHGELLFQRILRAQYGLMVDKWKDAAGNEVLGVVVHFIDS